MSSAIPKLGFPERFTFGYFKEEYANGKAPDFDQHYELLGQAAWVLDSAIYEAQDFWELGREVSPRACAFCDRTQQQGATFKMVSHAVPENLGNKRVLSFEECDTCNGKYSPFEMELARMLIVERAFGGSWGKSGPVGLKAGDLLDIQGKGVGKPIRLGVDRAKNPIRDTGPNSLEIPVEGVEYKPLPAMRSMLRSTWLLIPKAKRARFPFLLALATGQDNGLPFHFLSVFSPGAPISVGRIRVWGLRDETKDTELPAVVATLSLFNTTLVWRAPVKGSYVPGPLPPLPVYEEKGEPEVSRMRIDADEKVTSSHTFNVNYAKKLPGEPDEGQVPAVSAQKTAIDQLRATTDIEFSVAQNEAAVTKWLKGKRQVKRIKADLTGISHAVILAPGHGVLVTIKAMPGSDSYRVGLDFKAAGLTVSSALDGFSFVEAYAQAAGNDKLLIREGARVSQLPLQDGEVSGFDGSDFGKIRDDLALLQNAGQKIGIELRLPTPTQGIELSVLVLIAKAIVRGVPGRFRESITLELTWPHEEFDRLCMVTEPTRIAFGTPAYPLAGIPEFTEERIGPVRLYFEVQNPSQILPLAITKREADFVELRIELDNYCFALERFLPTTPP